MQACEMISVLLKMLLKNPIAGGSLRALIGLLLFSCASTKKMEKDPILLDSHKNTIEVQRSVDNLTTLRLDYDFDDHGYIRQKPALKEQIPIHTKDTLLQNGMGPLVNAIAPVTNLVSISPVAAMIVENYLKIENKEPDGHCLLVSRDRFELAYKEVYGHLPYQDLPEAMASKFYTSKQVFDLLYISASEKHQRWRSLPKKYRGKGNAGAIAYAGMGTLVDVSGIWSGQLQPGALVQVWRFKDDYEAVVRGTNVKELDPYGHSFIFIRYVRNKENAIVGLQIADQGFQSYRPLIPSDYEVWWGVNLTI